MVKKTISNKEPVGDDALVSPWRTANLMCWTSLGFPVILGTLAHCQVHYGKLASGDGSVDNLSEWQTVIIDLLQHDVILST